MHLQRRRLPWITIGRLAPALVLGLTCSPLAGAESSSAPANASAYLLVTDEQGEPLFQTAMPEGARWCLQWHHSVKKFAVLDCYRNHAGVMELERSHQPDFAAGLGHTQGRGEQLSDGEGGYWIEGIDEPVPGNRYALRVGALAVDHRLVWQRDGEAKSFSLSRRAAGERVTLQLTETALSGVDNK
ncbi:MULTISPECIES: DUF1850 domain-containing protein [unclassified Halomonas]|uniref:DUF1850 domain-containing protein n=1 Tax=unclassified Halomonas TaxID=2609666 RepID=UPI0006DB0F5F|nr:MULTISPECIES: DUF1850 domain-containing protein [unclassified Halomonas]KPQ20253.1 MAG: protein of unknown function containing DUF1850 domain [Halomonas sp. HL-93]SBR51014.1 protein of unknown function (DUF1850) [Halomonas sp. HL-93]SNY97150.1 protein of unknown function [Halomonas sp. hl-4]